MHLLLHLADPGDCSRGGTAAPGIGVEVPDPQEQAGNVVN